MLAKDKRILITGQIDRNPRDITSRPRNRLNVGGSTLASMDWEQYGVLKLDTSPMEGGGFSLQFPKRDGG